MTRVTTQRQIARRVTTRRVALLVETSTTWGTEVIRGVADYARATDQWLFFLEPRGRGEQLSLPAGWRPDGVIARVNSVKLAEQIAVAGIPAVDISWFPFAKKPIVKCTTAPASVARVAAEHLHERGLRDIAYCPPPGRPGYIDDLGLAFRDEVVSRGGRFSCFGELGVPAKDQPWPKELDRIARWLAELPKPVGVLAFSDIRARQLTEACQLASLRVPDQVAVLGSEQDNLSAMVSAPPLSSIDIGSWNVGHRAAQVLSDMMLGAAPPGQPVLLEPVGPIARQSTDVLATDDPLLGVAFDFIRGQAGRCIDVGDLTEHVGVSRRTLEKHFREITGRSPAEVLRRVRLERAQRLLYDTDENLGAIARKSGFPSLETMNRAFESVLGAKAADLRPDKLFLSHKTRR